MKHEVKIAKYFRQSLIDSNLLGPDEEVVLRTIGNVKAEKYDLEVGNFRVLSQKVWESGVVKNFVDNPALYIPKISVIKAEGTEFEKPKDRVFIPIVIPVYVSPEGSFKPSKTKPFVPRAWLSPINSILPSVGSCGLMDCFYTQWPFEGVKSWEDLKIYSTAILKTLSLGEVVNKDSSNPDDFFNINFEVFDKYHILTHENSLLQIKNLPLFTAASKAVDVLDFLVEQPKKINALFTSVISTLVSRGIHGFEMYHEDFLLNQYCEPWHTRL